MFELIRANQRRTVILVVAMAGLLLVLGYGLGEVMQPGFGPAGLVLAFLLWIVLTVVSWFSGAGILLSMSRARKISKSDHPVLFNIVEEMCIASGTPKVPDIYIIDDPSPNAFATGRDPEHAVVAVTSGLLEMMNRDELQGVVAHEIGHVRNRDILYMMMVGVMMGAIILLADVGRRSLFWGGRVRSRRSSRDSGGAQMVVLILAIVLILLAPLIAQLIYLALSRKREYLADASSALYTRYPEGLASALQKLGGTTTKLRAVNPATAGMYIVNPLAVTARGLADLTSTHPPISERIRILRSMSGPRTCARMTNHSAGSPGERSASFRSPACGHRSRMTPAAGRIADSRSRIERVRETNDLMWKLDQYAFIACPCGTKLKVPPVYRGKKIECPHCGRMHAVETPAG